LLPLLAGFIAGEQLPGLSPWAPCALAVAFTVPLAWLTWRDRLTPRTFAGLWLAAAACLGSAYYLERREPDLPTGWQKLPAREVVGEIRIERLFSHFQPDRPQRGIARLVEASGVETALERQRLVFELPADADLHLGAQYAVVGVIATPEADGGFARYLERQGVHLALDRVRRVEVSHPGGWWQRSQDAAQRRLRAVLLPEGFAPTPARLMLAAMLLGETELLPTPQRHAFMASGTLHYFAISGLHVAAVAATLDLLLRLFRLRPKPRTLAGLLLLAGYIWATGLAASAVRAGLMIAFWSLAWLWRRQAASLPALVASAVLVLLWSPRQLWTPGFQLSYLVAAAIILYGVPLARWGRERWLLFPWLPRQSWQWHHHWRQNIVYGLWSALSVSLAATLASWPLSLLYFHISSPGAWLLNVVLAPLASLAVAAGVLVIGFGLAGLAPLSHFFAYAAWLLLRLMEGAIAQFLSWPLSSEARSWQVDLFAWIVIGGFFACLLRALARRQEGLLRWSLPVLWILGGVVCFSVAT